ncbi:hypothetical protein I308_105971 [Cryptococcus tetragattii IND107]|uniref:MRH domain-containing protein n=1 Tax=Cryptococcus tetragattii IND107 TaxID=1296105 RepID=A0ABR3BM92_9TREE
MEANPSDYVAQVGDTTYSLNVCRSVVSELYKLDDPDKVGGFFRQADGDFSLGEVNTNLTLSPMTNEPMIIMTGGSSCHGNQEQTASTAIRFICSPSDFNAGKPILVASLPPQDPCQFYFEWNTHLACPTNPKRELETSHYYIAFGAIPSWGSWRRRSNRSGAYDRVRAEEHDEEEEGFAARFSLEESDGDAEDITSESNVWRSHQQGQAEDRDKGKGKGKVGVHEGLVNI